MVRQHQLQYLTSILLSTCSKRQGFSEKFLGLERVGNVFGGGGGGGDEGNCAYVVKAEGLREEKYSISRQLDTFGRRTFLACW